jgi:hypothetical protein
MDIWSYILAVAHKLFISNTAYKYFSGLEHYVAEDQF